MFAARIEQEQQDAANKLEVVNSLLRNATESFIANPTRENRISLYAAIRVVRETTAEAEEWLVEWEEPRVA